VFFVDQLLRRRQSVDGFLFDTRHNPWAGWVSMLVGMVVSIWLFSNQTKYLAPIPKHHPGFGDSTFEAGFLISAVLYFVLYHWQRGGPTEILVIPEARTAK
jgi:NCS1 family nucleobase:cation symporter-1